MCNLFFIIFVSLFYNKAIAMFVKFTDTYMKIRTDIVK